MRVEQFYNKNQFIIKNDGEVYFQSYNSTVAKIDKNGVLIFGSDWNYSNTTRKHLYLFLNDYSSIIKYDIQTKIHQSTNRYLNKGKSICSGLQKLINENIIILDNNL